jgi:hypothetical protein
MRQKAGLCKNERVMTAEFFYNRYAAGDADAVSEAIDSAKTVYIDDVPATREDVDNLADSTQTVQCVFADFSSLKLHRLHGDGGTSVGWGVVGIEQ